MSGGVKMDLCACGSPKWVRKTECVECRRWDVCTCGQQKYRNAKHCEPCYLQLRRDAALAARRCGCGRSKNRLAKRCNSCERQARKGIVQANTLRFFNKEHFRALLASGQWDLRAVALETGQALSTLRGWMAGKALPTIVVFRAVAEALGFKQCPTCLGTGAVQEIDAEQVIAMVSAPSHRSDADKSRAYRARLKARQEAAREAVAS